MNVPRHRVSRRPGRGEQQHQHQEQARGAAGEGGAGARPAAAVTVRATGCGVHRGADRANNMASVKCKLSTPSLASGRSPYLRAPSRPASARPARGAPESERGPTGVAGQVVDTNIISALYEHIIRKMVNNCI